MAKILVVDDEMGIRDLLQEILQDEGHTVITADNAKNATLKLREHRPDLVLLDIWLPDQDGIELHAKWCSDHLATMPVVVMSGHATIEHAITATRQGAADFLEKPISLPKLLAVVENLLAVRRPRNRILQLSDFASIEAFRFLGRRLSQACVKQRIVYLEGGDDWLGELVANSLCSGGGKMIRLDQLNEPIYVNDVKNGSVFFAGDLASLTKLPQKNFKFIADNIAKKPFILLFYNNGSMEAMNSMGWERSRLQEWMSNSVRAPTLASLSDFLPDVARILLSHYSSRGEIPDRQLSTEAGNIIAEHRYVGSFGDFQSKIKILANSASGNQIKARDAQEVFKSDDDKDETLPFSLNQPYREAKEQFEMLYFSRLIKREHGVMSKISELSGIERTHLYRKLKQIGLFAGGDHKEEKPDGKDGKLEEAS